MSTYDHKKIEEKWNQKWFEKNIYEAVDLDSRPKKYILAELPYPSGKALHAGHMMRYTVPDIYARYLRMRGYNVLFPIGWDAFGLPAENYAVKTGIHPHKSTQDIIKNYRESIRKMGYGIDWAREIDTTDPNYYKWTQWIFLKFFKAGLAEYAEMPIWWCDQLKTVLSDEEVLTDKQGNKISERGEYPVVRKNIKQWVLKITKYADKLLAGLDTIDFPDSVKNAQRNWIGRKEGINITYDVVGLENKAVTCFTTRPDTNFGATFVVLAPEHQFVKDILDKSVATDEETYSKISEYILSVKNKSTLERIAEGSKKTGVFTGFYVLNKLNNKQLPLWISDFVLNDFGTGAVVGVPAHDKRDFEFATQFGLEIIRVVTGANCDTSDVTSLTQVQEEEGTMVNSQFLDGLEIHEATKKMMEYLESQGWGKKVVTYSIRDWVFSRQRYWGEPIPLVHKEDGTIESICDPDNKEEVNKYLPLELPEVPDYNPTSDGSSPLEKNYSWVKTVAKDGTPAKRETNTMPNWAGSCWYYIRYIDPKNSLEFANEDKLKYWLPVDKYFGGAEHTTLHLLYSRFWHQFLYDNKLVPTPEPYAWRLNGGLLLGPDGRKMSKSIGNVVEPIDIVNKFGADALRMFIAFLGPYDETYPWNDSGVKATYKLIKTIYELQTKVDANYQNSDHIIKLFHKTIKNITEMVENLKMNTCISEFMILINDLKQEPKINKTLWSDLIKLLAPFAPFVAEELWANLNFYEDLNKVTTVHLQPWPEFDSKLAEKKVTEIPVQINGKVRSQIQIDDNDNEETIKEKLYLNEKLKPYLIDKPIIKLIYLPGKIVNVVN